MKLYIVRHGIAVSHGTPGVPEEERPLTREGISKMKEAAAGYRALGLVPDLILTSPLPRSLQTAEILKDEFGTGTKLEKCEALQPAGDRAALNRVLKRHWDLGAVMLVGHQPSLGEIAAGIAFGDESRTIPLRKGGGCGIDVTRISPRPEGMLEWVLTASLARRAGRR